MVNSEKRDSNIIIGGASNFALYKREKTMSQKIDS